MVFIKEILLNQATIAKDECSPVLNSIFLEKIAASLHAAYLSI